MIYDIWSWYMIYDIWYMIYDTCMRAQASPSTSKHDTCMRAQALPSRSKHDEHAFYMIIYIWCMYAYPSIPKQEQAWEHRREQEYQRLSAALGGKWCSPLTLGEVACIIYHDLRSKKWYLRVWCEKLYPSGVPLTQRSSPKGARPDLRRWATTGRGP